MPGPDDVQAPTKPVPTGLAGRVYRLRAEQAALDGETRMRRLLIGLLIIQVPVAIVMLLSGAFVAFVVDIVAVVVQIAAAQVFGPHDGDRHVPAKDEAMEQLIAGQRSELAGLREQAERPRQQLDARRGSPDGTAGCWSAS